MAYTITAQAGNAASIELGGGFTVIMPFDFDSQGCYGIHPNKSLVCCHLKYNAGKQADYPSLSSALFNHSNFDFTKEDTNLFSLNDYSGYLYVADQAIGCGEVIVFLKGKTSIDCGILNNALPRMSFTDWGAEGNSGGDYLFAWKGELRTDGTQLLKICRAMTLVRIDQNWLMGLTAIGPVTDNNDLFDWFVAQRGRGMLQKNDNVVVNYGGGALPEMKFVDLRRYMEGHDRKADNHKKNVLFGGTKTGIAQVTEARGAVFLCQGSFAGQGVLQRLGELARVTHSDGQDLNDSLERWAHTLITDFSLTEAASQNTRLEQSDDTLFQGLSVWGLKRRVDASSQQEEPNLPALL